MENLLTIRHLKKYYAAHKAVDDVSFQIDRGDIFGLLGPNGAGKTTLLRMITGILLPDEGDILLGGAPFDPARDVNRIGYMPEERGLYKKMAVGEQLLYLGRLKGMSYADARGKAKLWMKRFDLEGMTDSILQARTSVYQRSLYSRLSRSMEAFTVSPCLRLFT